MQRGKKRYLKSKIWSAIIPMILLGVFVGIEARSLFDAQRRHDQPGASRQIQTTRSISVDMLKSSLTANWLFRIANISSSKKDSTEPQDLAPIEPRIIEYGPRNSILVALTFDLCEKENDLAGYDARIVEILETKQTKATFFMGGKWAKSHPKEAASLGANPFFEIGNHSFSHQDFTKITQQEQEKEIAAAQESICRFTRITPLVFRFPYGTYDHNALKVVGNLGLVAIQWDIETGDPDPKISAESIFQAVKRKAQGGSIIIMHANGRGRHTAEALPRIIDTLRNSGYRLVTISEMLQN